MQKTQESHPIFRALTLREAAAAHMPRKTKKATVGQLAFKRKPILFSCSFSYQHPGRENVINDFCSRKENVTPTLALTG